MDPVALARALVDIDSTTGCEADAGRWLADYLRGRGFSVVEQPVDATRFNVLATLGAPSVVFSTHFDCVPPFFPSRVELVDRYELVRRVRGVNRPGSEEERLAPRRQERNVGREGK